MAETTAGVHSLDEPDVFLCLARRPGNGIPVRVLSTFEDEILVAASPAHRHLPGVGGNAQGCKREERGGLHRGYRQHMSLLVIAEGRCTVHRRRMMSRTRLSNAAPVNMCHRPPDKQ